jgi:transcriptional regulator with XRE-family HTH domain
MAVRKSVPFASRLRGRLSVLGESITTHPDVAQRQIAAKYGPKLARLVSEGNRLAIVLLSLREQRERKLAAGRVNTDQLTRLEEPIALIEEKLGMNPAPAGLMNESANILRRMEIATQDATSFESPNQFKQYLNEGVLLNISRIASQALSIPAGEYLIWTTDPGHTMLVPTSEEKKVGDEILKDDHDQQYEVHTRDLLRHWNKIERVMGEDGSKGAVGGDDEGDGEETAAQIKRRAGGGGEGGRPELATALQNADMTMSDLADQLGVDVSTISRWTGWGNGGGERNPSYDNLARLQQAGIDLEGLFSKGARPEIGPTRDYWEDEYSEKRQEKAKKKEQKVAQKGQE